MMETQIKDIAADQTNLMISETVLFVMLSTSSFLARYDVFSCFPCTSCLAVNELVPSMTLYTGFTEKQRHTYFWA